VKKFILYALITFTFVFSACSSDHKGHSWVSITDINTTVPIFISDDTVSVLENQINAITLVAIDDQNVTYSISEGDSADFDLNSTSGVVTFKVAPDFETNQNYTFVATATDPDKNTDTQNVTIIIIDAQETITHNGVTYGIVSSPYTGSVWLDRNIGASRVCTHANDTSCFGDYYQWGRNTDGHEKATSSTTNTQATDINSAGSDFILTGADYDYDWTDNSDNDGSSRANDWGNTNGKSVCPVGYRVPTIKELTDETLSVSNVASAFDNFLKLPNSGYRSYSDGIIASQGFYSSIWSNSIVGYKASYLYSSVILETGSSVRGHGRSVRCIKN